MKDPISICRGFDIGSNMFISGAPDSRWNNDDLGALLDVHGSDLEVLRSCLELDY